MNKMSLENSTRTGVSRQRPLNSNDHKDNMANSNNKNNKNVFTYMDLTCNN